MTNNDTALVNPSDMKRFITEIIGNSPHGIIDESDLEAAFDEFIDMHITASALSLWHTGKVKFSWRDGQMIWALTETP